MICFACVGCGDGDREASFPCQICNLVVTVVEDDSQVADVVS